MGMRFTLGENNQAICNGCGHVFSTPMPQSVEFTVECPNCASMANYWIEWYVNEIEDEEAEV